MADFVRRKFGHEILEYLVAPFVSGVYAGDPEKLSLKAAFPTLEEWEREYGSVLRGAMKSRSEKEKASGPPPLCSFKDGVGSLARSDCRETWRSKRSVGAKVTSVGRSANYQVCVECGGTERDARGGGGSSRNSGLHGGAHCCAGFFPS